MKKVHAIVTSVLLLAATAIAQVPKKVIVEHFTNSVCGVCSSKNPGFYTNLKTQSNVIHLSVHPSSPYSSCLINKHNTSENDARTNYYGIYGSTPRLVIQGAVISSGANYSSASIFTPYLNQTSPASVRIEQMKYGNDSIRCNIIIKTEEAHNLGNLKLFVALAEDTLFYSSPNGETKHYDVFRKSLTGATGISITLPATVGDSVVYSYVSTVNNAWIFSRIFTLAILQDATTKAVVQSNAAPAKQNDITTSVTRNSSLFNNTIIYPNPVNDQLTIKLNNTSNVNYIIYDVAGKELISGNIVEQSVVDVSNLPRGNYVITLTQHNQYYSQQFNKQ